MAPTRPKAHTDQYGFIFRICTDSRAVKGLSDSTFRVWVMFNVLVGGRPGGLTITSEELARACHMSRSTFFRCVKTLKQKKLLRCTRHGTVDNVKTLANHWVLLNPEGIIPRIKDRPFGVNTGIDEKPIDTSQCQSRDWQGSNSLRIQEPSVLTVLNNEANSETPNYETPRVSKDGETLTGFLGSQIATLYNLLATQPPIVAAKYLYNSVTLCEIQNEGRQVEAIEHWWNLSLSFDKALPHFGEYSWGLGYSFILDKAVESFSLRSAADRALFLTECAHYIRVHTR